MGNAVNKPYPRGAKPPWPHTGRGVHLLPAAYHGTWMTERGMYWIDLLKSMHISWVVIITDGDSVLEELEVPGWGVTTPLKFLLDHQIVPIVRDGTTLFPRPFMNMECVSRAVELFRSYDSNAEGLDEADIFKPIWLYANEPFDDREYEEDWLDRHPMPDANDPNDFEWVMGKCQERASRVIENGGIAGFPDGPCYPQNPFEHLDKSQWKAEKCVYAAHNYGKNRPRDYPYDSVTQAGTPLTEQEYRAALDDFWNVPDFRDCPLEVINVRRMELKQPGLTAIQDDTCWRGWEKTLWYAEQAGFSVPPLILTEGGWCPRDRAGTGPNTDIRWPNTTPKMVGKKTLEMFGSGPFFAQCPWLLADDAMVPGGYVGWPYDAWVGWAYSDTIDQDTGKPYGPEKPVIDMLIDNPPGKDCPWANVRRSFEAILTA